MKTIRLPFLAVRPGVLGLAALLLAACAPMPPTGGLAPPVRVAPAPVAAKALAADERCGGALEAQTWALWDAQGRKFLREQLIGARLLRAGDSYALYDMQTYFHNIEAMAERCQRTERLVQLADDLMPLLGAQQPLPGKPDQRGWVCQGGAICNARNKLINTEVSLDSVQGLGLMSALAGALARSPDPQARAHPFIGQTVQASVAHLLRWGDASARRDWQRRLGAQPQDVKDGSSALFFTDYLLWQIAVYANVAGVAVQQPELMRSLGIERATQNELAQNIDLLLRFFRARLSLATIDSPRLGRVRVADLDRGFWRLRAENRYAGYTGTTPPALCRPGGNGMQAQLMVDAKDIAPVADLGWDFSHARRLVHALDALGQNRPALQAWYGLPSVALPPADLPQAFAAQLLAKVWNGDAHAPLFANYWSGANGWYRVAYDNGTGYCYAGYPPFGLSDSFATGGYATWAQYYPLIGELARTLLNRSASSQPDDQAFIRTHFPNLSATASASSRMLTQLMFWPSLIR